MTRRLCDQVRSLRLALTLCVSIGLGGSGIGARPAWGDTAPAPATAKPRARDLGVPFEGQPGPDNAITDVPGVEVGQVTLISGTGPLVVGKGPVRTGVTAILPRGKTARPRSVSAVVCLNGNGELTGSHWVNESGLLESPILITNTDSVGVVRDAVIAWGNLHFPPGPHEEEAFALPVVAETSDSFLNDIAGQHVKREHVFRALDEARPGPVREGNVGGGTGMMTSEFKGGIGTSSRVVTLPSGKYTVGVLVQANYGRRGDLRIAGVPVGQEIPELMPEFPPTPEKASRRLTDRRRRYGCAAVAASDGSAGATDGSRIGSARRGVLQLRPAICSLALVLPSHRSARRGCRPGLHFSNEGIDPLAPSYRSRHRGIDRQRTGRGRDDGRSQWRHHPRACPTIDCAQVLRKYGRLTR
jgi:hypothetical protein